MHDSDRERVDRLQQRRVRGVQSDDRRVMPADQRFQHNNPRLQLPLNVVVRAGQGGLRLFDLGNLRLQQDGICALKRRHASAQGFIGGEGVDEGDQGQHEPDIGGVEQAFGARAARCARPTRRGGQKKRRRSIRENGRDARASPRVLLGSCASENAISVDIVSNPFETDKLHTQARA